VQCDREGMLCVLIVVGGSLLSKLCVFAVSRRGLHGVQNPLVELKTPR